MQQRTTLAEEPEIVADSGVLEREVETVRTREHVAGPGLDGLATEIGEPRYIDTLPERLSDLGFVVRASIHALLVIRFLLLASGANRAGGFGAFVEGLSWVFASPFANLFPNSSSGPGVIEWSTLVAIVVWELTFVLLRRLIRALAPRLRADAGRRSLITRWTSRRVLAPSLPAVVQDSELSVRPAAEHGHHRRYRLLRARRS